MLGAPEERFKIYKIQPFDVNQAKAFLKKKGASEVIPDWAPTRPLFLNYLIGRNLLDQLVEARHVGSFPEGSAWTSLLNMIAERESDQSEGVDKQAILDFLAALSSKARHGKGVDRSFSPSEIDGVFYSVTGNTISDEERRLLLRLPGLGIASDNSSNRSFVDQDFMNVCGAMSLFKFIGNPYSESEFVQDIRQVSEQLNQSGISALCSMLDKERVQRGVIKAALDREVSYGQGMGGALAYDIFLSLLQISPEIKGKFHFDGIDIRLIDLCQEFDVELNLTFSNCIIETILMPAASSDVPNFLFHDCLVIPTSGETDLRRGFPNA